MALIFTDGFDAYKTTGAAISTVVRKWSFVNTLIVDAAGRNQGRCIQNNTGNLTTNIFTSQATWIFGFAFKRLFSQNNYSLVQVYDTGTVQVKLNFNTSNNFEVTLGTGGVIASGTFIPIIGVWYFIEFKCTINNSTGAVSVKVNGTTDISASSVDTQVSGNASANKFELANTGSSNFYDDIYICDSTGSFNNDFLGDVCVETIFPDGAGNSTTWTPLSGSNFSNVDEIAVDDDTSYVSTATATNVDTYTYGNLSFANTVVKGLSVNVVNRKDDAGARTLAPVVRSGGTDYVGTTQSSFDSYTDAWQAYDTNPDTSTAWTPSEVNGAEFGAKLIS
jgi:hypothetical protein